MGSGSITSLAYYDVGNVEFIGIGSPDIVWVRTANEHTAVGIRVFNPERHRQWKVAIGVRCHKKASVTVAFDRAIDWLPTTVSEDVPAFRVDPSSNVIHPSLLD